MSTQRCGSGSVRRTPLLHGERVGAAADEVRQLPQWCGHRRLGRIVVDIAGAGLCPGSGREVHRAGGGAPFDHGCHEDVPPQQWAGGRAFMVKSIAGADDPAHAHADGVTTRADQPEA